MRYDIVFWAHGHNETERYLPLMVSLQKKGIRTLLFYQNYNFRNGLSITQQEIVKKHNLDILDYSYFLKNSLILKIVTIFVNMFAALKISFLYNKFIGLRSKLMRLNMREEFINKVLAVLRPKISFFDTISLASYRDYPYGSYYIKKLSDQLRIKSLSIHHGGTGHLLRYRNDRKKGIDFYKIYVPNDYEKQAHKEICINENVEILSLGDPRFDTSWKNEIKRLFSSKVEMKIKRLNIKTELKLLYLSPNLEHIGEESAKYKNLDDIVRLCERLGNITLLIKPHPRYRNEGKIRHVMTKNNFRNFFILDDSPLACYLNQVDFIVSLTTSALHDVLPEGYKKVIIYDNFSEAAGIVNIFREDFNYFNTYQKLFDFLKERMICRRDMPADENKDEKILDFCRKWTAADKELDTVIREITDDICQEMI